jgi:hypothetical protein
MDSSSENIVWPPELQRFISYRPQQLGPTPANLRQLEQLLYKIWSKKSGKTKIDQQVLTQFQLHCGLDQAIIVQQEQHILQLLNKSQSVLIGFAATINPQVGSTSTLCAWVVNCTMQLFREVQIRISSPDLSLPEKVQPKPVKLLDAQSLCPVYIPYQAPQEPVHTNLSLQVDICDHQGIWHAYKSRGKLFLTFPGLSVEHNVKIQATAVALDKLDFRQLSQTFQVSKSKHHDDSVSQLSSNKPSFPSLDQAITIPLDRDEVHTRHLRAVTLAKRSHVNRGTPLTRALLRSQGTGCTAERIELVSRPFMVFGRYNERTQTHFGDFALGFVPKYERISRMHFAVSARPEGLAILHTGSHERSYTALNGRELPKGRWCDMASGDRLDVAGLYALSIALEWDTTQTSSTIKDTANQAERCGEYLLEIVQLMRQLGKTASNDLKRQLRKAFNELNRLQEKDGKRNGIEANDPLLYARFQREGAGHNRAIHIYLPKRIAVGSAPQRGLQIEAGGVCPHHADLLYQDGMYWIQNCADAGEVQVCHHKLANNEKVALESGDTIDLGAAQFVFEGF